MRYQLKWSIIFVVNKLWWIRLSWELFLPWIYLHADLKMKRSVYSISDNFTVIVYTLRLYITDVCYDYIGIVSC